jgi:hypothetical protein
MAKANSRYGGGGAKSGAKGGGVGGAKGGGGNRAMAPVVRKAIALKASLAVGGGGKK